ncbi:MAG: heavy-metal-associated domain-containing protein [Bacillota bacterium]|jgi:cation transport ATPase
MSQEFRSWRVGGLDSNESKFHLQRSLSEMNDIEHVNVNMLEKTVEFSFNPRSIDEEFIKHTINTLGYSFLGDLTPKH